MGGGERVDFEDGADCFVPAAYAAIFAGAAFPVYKSQTNPEAVANRSGGSSRVPVG